MTLTLYLKLHINTLSWFLRLTLSYETRLLKSLVLFDMGPLFVVVNRHTTTVSPEGRSDVSITH